MIRVMLAAVIALQCSAVLVIAAERSEQTQSTSAERMPIAARDDSAIDLSFVRFRDRLIAAARTGDVSELIAMMSSSVRVDSEPVTPAIGARRFWR